ncbi:hypothetical protein D3C73_1403190 [compost metagenome]
MNSLLTGIGLACELDASSDMNRAFVKIQSTDKQKYLNKAEPDTARFYLRKYEVPIEYLENGWDVSDDELEKSVHIKDIIGIKSLEKQLIKYLDHFSRLIAEWRCDNPL